MSTIKIFRITSIAEGVSLLILFGLAMPLKYIFNQPLMVEIIGMLHGILFIAYILFAIYYKFKVTWNFKDFLIVSFSSIIPFGTFYVDKKYLAKIEG